MSDNECGMKMSRRSASESEDSLAVLPDPRDALFTPLFSIYSYGSKSPAFVNLHYRVAS